MRVVLPLLPVWAGGLLVMGLVALGNRRLVEELLLDANDRAGVQWYVGVVTSLGVISWCTAAVSAGWGAWVSRLDGRRDASRYLAIGAALTAWVLLDDLLQLHAVVIPGVLGLPKHAVEASLVVAVTGWLVRWRSEVLRTRWVVLVWAGSALVASLAVDALAGWGSPRVQLLVEDGAKLLGALGWATYFVVTVADITRSVMVSGAAASEVPDRVPSADDLDPVPVWVTGEAPG